MHYYNTFKKGLKQTNMGSE